MAQWHRDWSVVYPSAALPMAWTDLDLSAIVGEQHALVSIQVQIPAVGGYFACRTNGDTSDFRQFAVGARGVHAVHIPNFVDGAGRFMTVICETDADGVVEIISDSGFTAELLLAGWAPVLHADTLIHSGAPPAAWTDIQLNPVTGTDYCLVLLKLEETNGVAGQGAGFRRNGTAWETVPAASEAAGCAFAELGASDAAYLLVWSSAASIVEWKRFAANAASIDVTIVCYIPESIGWTRPRTGEEEVFNGALPGAFADLDLTMSTTPAITGMPAGECLAVALLHDIAAFDQWSWREDGSAYNYEKIGNDSYGSSGVLLQAGANQACLVAMSTLAGIVEHDSFFLRVAQIDLVGWIEPYDGLHPPSISREYPAAEQIVAQDTEIRFRLSDDTGIQLATLNVTLSTVDESRPLIVNGAWGVKDGVQQASGLMLANEVHGYDIVIHPAAELGDRRWTVTVDVDNSDGTALP